MDKKEILHGGRNGKIHKLGEKVIRPSNKWTQDVHDFLRFIHAEGADFVPYPYEITDYNKEVLSFLPGEVFHYPLPKQALTDNMLISVAKLLWNFHQYSRSYVSRLTNKEQWMLPIMSPVEVLCHGDFAPYNVTIEDHKATSIIDFDTLHPGSEMWDISYAIYRWVPFTIAISSDELVDVHDQIRRTKLFMDTYEVTNIKRNAFVAILISRLKSLIDFMVSEANNGNDDFKLNIEKGHLEIYLNDIAYLQSNESLITKGIQL